MRKVRTFFVFLGLLALWPALAIADAPSKTQKLSIETAAHKAVNLTVEIADTEETRARGLMQRTTLAEDHGMLFVFGEDSYIQMWMKDTPISLDMLFIDSHGKIVYIAEKTVPQSTDIISAKREARAVLEVAAGVSEKLGVKVGDRVVYSAFKP